MTPQDNTREQLSAWMDGELDADAERFLLRRLQHDDALAGQVERWHLAGDVLKGMRVAPVPKGFARRVRDTIAADAVGIATQAAPARGAGASPPTARPWTRYVGGVALAAALGLVALGVRHQSLQSREPAPAVVASTAAPVQRAPSPLPSAAGNSAPATPEPRVVATAERSGPSARVQERAVRRAAAPTARRARTAPAASGDTAIARAEPASSQASPNPFRVTAPEPSPAWPRAILPGAGPASTLSASFVVPQGGVFTPVPSLRPERIVAE